MPPQIPIVYQDDHLVVVDKPRGLLVVKAPGRTDATVVDAVGQTVGRRVYAVHRLDEDTSGLLVLARTEEAKGRLEAVFRKHAAEREYLALLSRMPSPPAGRVESRLAVGADGVVRSVDDRSAQRAVTEYRCLERRGPFTLVACRLLTGRRNQIRVHMQDLGCPVVGDRKYGYRAPRGDRRRFRRPLLHAWRLRFAHPFTGEMLELSHEPREPELRAPADGPG